MPIDKRKAGREIRNQRKLQQVQLSLEKDKQREQDQLQAQRNKKYSEFADPVKALKSDLLLILDELKTEGVIKSFEKDNGISAIEGSTHASCSITLNCDKTIKCAVSFLLRSDELLPFSENPKGLNIKLMVNKIIANYCLLKERIVASITVRQLGLQHEYQILQRSVDYIKSHSTGPLHSVRHSTPYEDTTLKIDLVFMWKSHKGPIPGPFIDVKSKFPSYKTALTDWYKLEDRDQYGFPMYINDDESDYNFEKFIERVIQRGYEMHGRD
jgi:hypothetical protein